jgi:hypothetical protein
VSTSEATGKPVVEWVGQERESSNPSRLTEKGRAAAGAAEDFDIVILAVGFGIEKDSQTPYWRNETFAQPGLGHARQTFIISGAGDGAMIDLFRLRIANFRQDRILSELVGDQAELLESLRMIIEESDASGRETFDALNRLWDGSAADNSGPAEVLSRLSNRLRHDTHVILHVRNASFADLFTQKRVSFQNRLLSYLLYRSGGFHPQVGDLDAVARDNGVSSERVIVRHGTQTAEGMESLLADPLKSFVAAAHSVKTLRPQSDDIQWPGGYFDRPWNESDVDDALKGHWRKEYLPSPLQASSAAFCAAVAGFLLPDHPEKKRLRVTLHRTVIIGNEILLQQACEYQGNSASPTQPNAGRTFPAGNGTIGYAMTKKSIVRSKRTANNRSIIEDMNQVELNTASRNMSQQVQSIAAIPMMGGASGSDVVGVLYLDSAQKKFFNETDRMRVIAEMCKQFLGSVEEQAATSAGRLANNEFWRGPTTSVASVRSIGKELFTFETVDDVKLPMLIGIDQLNLDFSDFAPVGNLR